MSYYLVLASNAWISERMLYSALGSATLYTLTKHGSVIGLPEIVRLEVDFALLNQAEKAVDTIQKSLHFLRQISGQQTTVLVPSQRLIREGIERRWDLLSGVLEPLPFGLEHARAALSRIIQKSPPCGANNEQFRDCCIWQCAVDLAARRPVHFVTNDHAFFEGGNRSSGLSNFLVAELKRLNCEVHLHSSLNSFLSSTGTSLVSPTEGAIRSAIIDAVMPKAREIILKEAKEFELGEVRNSRVTGYATPKVNVVAVSFSISFNMVRVEIVEDVERRLKAILQVIGECSHDPNSDSVLDVEVSEWSMSVDEEDGGHWGRTTTRPELFSEGSFRSL